MKIESGFQYDAFRFLISGVRNSEFERFFGLPSGTNPEKSIQGLFEQMQARIKSLPQLLDPKFASSDLDELLKIVGWDGSPSVDFLGDIDDETKRKLIALSVPLWKLKGTDSGIIGALRIFTGKTVILRNWFFHRWILDEAGFWYENNGADLWLNGGRYSEADEALQWVILNRAGIGEVERRVIYDILGYLRAAGEHFGVVYAAFADDFGRGTPSTPTKPAAFTQWDISAGEDFVEYNMELQKAELYSGGALIARMAESELWTWTPTQRVSCEIATGTTPEHIAEGAWEIEIKAMISGDSARYYSTKVSSDGAVLITRDGVTTETGSFTPPLDGFSFVIEIQIEPLDSATNVVTVLIGGQDIISDTFVGIEAYDDPNGSVEVSANDGAFFIDNVIILASPNRVQYIGQAPLTPVPALGAPSYVANPDPGVEPFEG